MVHDPSNQQYRGIEFQCVRSVLNSHHDSANIYIYIYTGIYIYWRITTNIPGKQGSTIDKFLVESLSSGGWRAHNSPQANQLDDRHARDEKVQAGSDAKVRCGAEFNTIPWGDPRLLVLLR